MKQGIETILTIANRNDRFKALLDLMEPGDLVIDCGANLGDVAIRFARRGCEMHCFEPDPKALEVLRAKLSGQDRVTIHDKAVWTGAGTARLHFHPSREGEVNFTQSSSLMADKINVDPELGVEVELVDFPAFLRALDRPAAVLKIDIEGAEGELLKAILEQHLEDRFELCLVETHERKVPSSREPMRQVRQIITQRGIRHIFLDWK
jgi:FkbM family methyltransferase